MRLLILTASAAVALAACSGGNDAQNTDNGTDLQVENLVVNESDLNAMGADLNTMNATDNAVANDLTTNDADTNLSNGL